MKIIELLIDTLDELTGVDAVALVEEPAIESNFFAFSKEENLEETILYNFLKLNIEELTESKIKEETQEVTGKHSFAVVEDQQMVVGPLMIPEKLILRIDEATQEPYYVFFSQETIKEVAHKMMKNKFIDSLNIEHNPEDVVDGYMVSTWIVEDVEKDKQAVYGFNCPVGTLMGQYKIESKEAWAKVKAGEIKGFSVEGFFSDRFVQAKAI